MKDVLRKLLDAEQAGQLAARAQESAARELVDRAREQAERAADEARARGAREIAALELATDQEIARQQAALQRATEAELQRLEQEGNQFHRRAVAATVARLLDEPPAAARFDS